MSDVVTKYLIAEYSPGPFYMGWSLFERDRNDGSRNDDPWNEWGCLCGYEGFSKPAKVRELVVSLGREPPALKRYSKEFIKWFARHFPNGIKVRVHKGHYEDRYELIEVCQSRPRQRRGAVRTIRGAAMAYAAQKKRESEAGDE